MNRNKRIKETVCRACLAAFLLMLVLAGCGRSRERFAQEAPSYEGNAVWGHVPVPGDVQISPIEASAIPSLEEHVLEESSTRFLVSRSELKKAMETYHIEENSTAAQALEDINDVYAEEISPEQWNETLVFFFEGAGKNDDPEARSNAMCVVVMEGRIAYLNQGSTTIPDHPFLPRKNDDYDVPTLKSGIYSFDTVDHNGKYAALRVLEDQVVRFHTKEEFYEDISLRNSIEVHRRYTDENSPEEEDWANSVGCLMVGGAGTSVEASYTKFIQAVGAIPENAGGNTRYQTMVTGILILDRRYGVDYMKEVGYSDEALELLSGAAE